MLEKIRWKTRVIDAHAHDYGIESSAHFHQVMELLNYTKSNLMAITAKMNDGVLQRKRERPGRFYIFGGMDHLPEQIAQGDGAYLVPQIDRLMAQGFDGIKCLEGKPSLRREWMPHAFDHQYYRPFWEKLAADDIPITVHTGDPVDFWAREDLKNAYRDFLPQEEYFRQAEAVLERHPNLKINFAHFFFLAPQLDRLGALFARFPQFYVDLAPGSEYLYYLSDDPQKSREFFIRWKDRILFGTDVSDKNALAHARSKAELVRLFLETGETYVNPTAAAMKRPPEAGSNGRLEIRGLDLPQDVLERILWRNFESFVSKEPKPLPA